MKSFVTLVALIILSQMVYVTRLPVDTLVCISLMNLKSFGIKQEFVNILIRGDFMRSLYFTQSTYFCLPSAHPLIRMASCDLSSLVYAKWLLLDLSIDADITRGCF